MEEDDEYEVAAVLSNHQQDVKRTLWHPNEDVGVYLFTYLFIYLFIYSFIYLLRLKKHFSDYFFFTFFLTAPRFV